MLQTAGFIFGGVPFLEAMRRRYGGAVTMTTLFDDGFVMVFDPDLVKAVFQGPVESLHAGEANALLGPILGDRSVLLLDGAEHLSHRRLMLPFFHGRQLNAHVQTMRLCADEEIDRWPIGKPFRLLPAMQAITLNVMLRAVFGYELGPQRDELAACVRSMIDPLARPRGVIALRAVLRGRDDARAAQKFEMRRRAVDDLLYAEITRRRADPALAGRDDVFSTLLLARDSSEQGLSDREVRDELLTLLLAGHETTATGLAWTLDLLLHDRRAPAASTTARPKLPRCSHQGVPAVPDGDPWRRARRAGATVPAWPVHGPARNGDQSLDPYDPSSRRPLSPTA